MGNSCTKIKEEEIEDYIYIFPQKEEEFPSVEQPCPLDIPLILSKVMSYLPLPTLKGARLVSHFWGEMSLDQFLLKSAITFDPDHPKKWCCTRLRQLLALHRGHVPFTNFKFLTFQDHVIFARLGPQEPRFIHIMETLTESIGPKLRSLHIQTAIYFGTCKKLTDFEWDHSRKILANCPNLVQLYLEVSLIQIKNVQASKEVLSLKKLKDLRVSLFMVHGSNQVEERIQELAKDLFKMAPNLRDLSLGDVKGSKAELILQDNPVQTYSHCFLEQLLESGINLESLTVENCYGRDFRIILQIVGILKRICFGMNVNGECCLLLHQLISNHVESLVDIQIKYFISNELPLEVTIHLPVLPKLRIFSLKFYRAQDAQTVDIFRLKELIESGEQDFRRKFPLLEKLELKVLLYEGFVADMYSELVPNSEEVEIHQIRWLEVYYPTQSLSYKDWVKRLSRMFPHVYNPHINRYLY